MYLGSPTDLGRNQDWQQIWVIFSRSPTDLDLYNCRPAAASLPPCLLPPPRPRMATQHKPPQEEVCMEDVALLTAPAADAAVPVPMAGPILAQLGAAAGEGSSLLVLLGDVLRVETAGVTGAEPHHTLLPLADVGGLSASEVFAAEVRVTVCYAPYEPAEHSEYKKGPIGDTPGTARHRRHRPLALRVLCSSTEFAQFAATLRSLLAQGGKQRAAGGAAAPPAGSSSSKDVGAAQPRPLLVLLNPASGAGAAKRLYDTDVAPLLASAGSSAQVVETTHAGHAAEVVGAADLSALRGVVVVSGDGLVSEVLNALMRRADWAQAIRTPIGHVPGGSGNGLATSWVAACMCCRWCWPLWQRSICRQAGRALRKRGVHAVPGAGS
jgi:hypothetical protein